MRSLGGCWILLLAAMLLSGCDESPQHPYVVLYTSQDQFYAEPILKAFTAETGIEVRSIFDTESAKTTGLAQRLRAESNHPQCDVFWSNEEMHTRLLVREGVLEAKSLRSAGARTRRLVINTNHVPIAQAPTNLLELSKPVWKGRLALAFPLFGTTKSHFLALRQLWGDERWKAWCRGLAQNDAKVVDGNSVVVKLVGAGESWIGLTDSDDITAGLAQGMPIAALPTNGEFLAIPSTVALTPAAPHGALAEVLASYLTKRETIERLVSSGALESVNPAPSEGNLLQVNWEWLLDEADAAMAFLESVFVRS